MKKVRSIIALALALVLCLGLLAGCNSNGDNPQPTGGERNPVSEGATYTYRSYNTYTPITWNSHEVEVDEYITQYTQMTMWEQILNDTADGYVWTSEMASGEPEDVTSEYAGDEAWGIPADATEGYAWRVTLNPDAKWEDGTPINADSYVYSMSQVLSPEMNNYNASYWYTKFPIYNAENYFKAGDTSMVPVIDINTGEYADYGDSQLYISFTQPTCGMWGYSAADYYYGYEDYYVNEAGEDLIEKYGGEDYIPATEEAIADVNAFLEGWGYDPESWLYMAFYEKEYPITDWEDVGFFKTGEYELTVILTSPMSEFYFKYNSDDYALVNEALYEAGKQQTGDMIKTNYGTSASTYMSYGPYKLVSFQSDKEYTLTRNENWYGWSDGRHDGQYQTTDIVCTVIDDDATAEMLFLQGKLDSVSLNSDNFSKYQGSDYIVFFSDATVYFLNINNDYDALLERQSDGINKTILSYLDFRKGISLAINRSEFTAMAGSGMPMFGYYNELSIYDPETGENYLNSEPAEETLKTLYGVNDVDEITGYDLDAARASLVAGYEQALADGEVSETDKFVFTWAAMSNDSLATMENTFIQNALDAAAAGTPLEGRITVELQMCENYYDVLDTGEYDLCISGWNADAYNPYSFMQYFIGDSITDQGLLGFDPYSETLEVEINGTVETKTFYDWYCEMYYGEYALADASVRNELLAQLELGLLLKYRDCPFYSSSTASLLSKKIAYPTYEPVCGNDLGGIRFMTFNYTDAEWDAFCTQSGGQLNYN